MRGKGFAESTINKYVQMAKALFRWATKKGDLTRNPAGGLADSPAMKARPAPSTYLNATRVGLQDAMRRLDASRCKPVASETETDRAPHGNADEATTAQPLVN